MATATPYAVHLDPKSDPGIFHAPTLTADAAASASELLQANHDKWHIFFNNDGFHNHIAHHMLTSYALGATSKQLKGLYQHNADYQRKQYDLDNAVVQHMRASREGILKYMNKEAGKVYGGTERYFRDFEEFFAKEIEEHGWVSTLKEWLLKGDKVSEALLTRLYAGFLHPIIHLGFAWEFHQPAIIAEGLAETAVHDNWMSEFLLSTEKKAQAQQKSSVPAKKSILELLEEARANPTIRGSPHWPDANKVRDGVLVRAKDETIDLCSQWYLPANPSDAELEKAVAEHIHAAAYYTGCAAFAASGSPPSVGKKSKEPKYDFFYMHALNCSIFFSALATDPALSSSSSSSPSRQATAPTLTNADKARLLQMKVWTDIALYISRGSPSLSEHLVDIDAYQPQHPQHDWPQLFERVNDLANDDGHAAKIMRAFAHANVLFGEHGRFAHEDWVRIRPSMWLKLGHLVIDSQASEPTWVRGAGFSEAWDKVPAKRETENEVDGLANAVENKL